ncbi:Rid family detoxifying hydrolase [Endozoicomonas arenosclerae]|uniref:Rid family detoxifying hydrolase n=1 Tax=Endozoicomonas arenosclerae TaxID=1633495 RepID=UPI0007813CFA|nr:Rid family detoxifying hydrolase [Endozoicomonas arenosclerae]
MNRLTLAGALIASLALPVSVLAAEHQETVEFLNSGKIIPDNLPLSEAVKVGNTLYLSGQIGLKPGSMQMVEGGVKEETRQTMDNISSLLKMNGYSMGEVVKCTVILTDINNWAAFNEVYQSYFSAPYPARTVLGSSGLALGAKVEVECMAAKGR